ncbi:ATP-binding protein [Rathayibacter sp. SD072]|uniref:ATP-binding protein n=1 Tax=Rathayibacter sp. SD072 TaxID=2781731 RepID=UPI001A961BB7|nr:ATP-binding protein [Rathayibacter sp. SD072]MBO0985308.1 ATP-binding protein [Rathayibacter sp. SD072]
MSERSIVFRTPPDGVEAVHGALETLWQDRTDVDEMERMMFETALIELVSNVVQHASSTTTIICQLRLEADESVLRAVLVDTADPPLVDTDTVVEMPDEFAESGRGIPFIQALVDSFDHEREHGRNVWTIAKHRPSSAS